MTAGLFLASASGGESSPRGKASIGTRIAFASNRDGDFEIYTVLPDGSHVRQLTHNRRRPDFTPAFSPTGQRIAFSSVVPNTSHDGIYTIRADGTARRQLFTKGHQSEQPAFSPSGQRIAFRFCCGNTGDEIATINAAGGSPLHRLTDDRLRYEAQPAYSPIDGRIAFTRDVDPTLQGYMLGIYSMRPDGSDKRLLTDDGIDPDFSPSGARIAFIRDGDVYTMGADGSAPLHLTQIPGEEGSPVFSPSGARIAFARDDDIFTMRADGTDLRRIPHVHSEACPLSCPGLDWGSVPPG